MHIRWTKDPETGKMRQTFVKNKKGERSAVIDPHDKFTSGEESKPSMMEKIKSGMTSTEKLPPYQKIQRPAELIEKTKDGKLHVRNFRWGFKEKPGKDPEPIFKDTMVDPSKIKNVYMVLEPFAPEWIAGHSMMCYEFEPGGIAAKDGSTDDKFIMSVEARLREGQKYSLIDGFKKTFKNVFQLGTWKDSVQKRGRLQGHKLMRFPLKLDQKQKEQLVRNTIGESCRPHDDKYYHTTRNNCYGNQLKLLNTVLPPEKKVSEWLIPKVIRNPFASIPKGMGMALARNDLLDGDIIITQPDKKRFPNLQKKKTTFGDFLRKVTKTGAWHAFTTFTGALAGAALGSLMAPPGLGALVGAVVGGYGAAKTGGSIKRAVNYKIETTEQYLDGPAKK